jgi:hypothetical protein
LEVNEDDEVVEFSRSDGKQVGAAKFPEKYPPRPIEMDDRLA